MDSSKPIIRFCVNNPRNLDERNNLIAMGFDCLGCLGNCEVCFETRYLEINGRFITGDSFEQILEKSIEQADKKTPHEDHEAP